MQQKRSKVVWWVVIILAVLMWTDPFGWFESNNMPRLRTSRDTEQEMIDFLGAAESPVDFVVSMTARHDIVMIGETGFVKQQLELVSDLIPALSAAGVRNLGVHFANRADQPRIDELLTADEFDEEMAQSILFEYQVILGYQEYLDVFRSAWQVNQEQDGGNPFRIIGLSLSPDYSHLQEQGDIDDPAVMQKVMASGIPDAVVAETVLQEIVDKGGRAVVVVQMPMSFTDFQQGAYSASMASIGFPGQHRAGNILNERLGDRVATVLFHAPIENTRSRIGLGYPLGGLIEKVTAELPEESRARGFLTGASPFADAPVSSDTIQEDREEDLTFAEYTDGYLYLVPLAEYTPVTPIPDFITEENIVAAQTQFPGPTPLDAGGNLVGVEGMNSYIAESAESRRRYYEEFDKR